MTEQGPEPTGWELMRGLNRIETILQSVASSERVARAEARIRDLENKAADSDKLKQQQRLTISLAIASPVFSLLIVWLLGGGIA